MVQKGKVTTTLILISMLVMFSSLEVGESWSLPWPFKSFTPALNIACYDTCYNLCMSPPYNAGSTLNSCKDQCTPACSAQEVSKKPGINARKTFEPVLVTIVEDGIIC
ncbi:conserved hypothetical protein [Ricinus communis]|uniref:Uncharacterized protein n=1 Tax=Ricinus communis TaxID=3988 RepID=B9SQH9_RICCO|nr:conserved hypothetical protein [Ricinus communis]